MTTIKEAAQQSFIIRPGDMLVTDGGIDAEGKPIPFDCCACGDPFEVGQEVVSVKSAFSNHPQARDTIHLKCVSDAEVLP